MERYSETSETVRLLRPWLALFVALLVAAPEALSKAAVAEGASRAEACLAEADPPATVRPDAGQGSSGRSRSDTTQTTQTTAPGSDPNTYVPGTNVGNYGQTGFFSIGRIRVRPAARLSYLYESNIFAEPSGRFSDHAYQLEPSVDFLLPAGQDGIRIGYAAAYRDYRRFELQHKWSHTLNADSRFALTPILSFSLRDHLARSILDAREYMPGREVFFSDSPFWRNDVEAELGWDITERQGLVLSGWWNRVRFDSPDPGSRLPFYDYDGYRAGGTYRRDVTQRTSLFATAGLDRVVADDPRGLASSRGFDARGGIRSALSPLVTGQLSVGFQRTRYPGAAIPDFRGAVYRCDLTKEFTESIQVSLAAFRGTYPSFYERNPFFVAHGVGMTYSQVLGRNFSFFLSPGYQRNTYPLSLAEGPQRGTTRQDEILELTVNARYRFSNWLAIDVLLGAVRRHSRLPEFNFTDYRVGVSLLVGQEGITRGSARFY